MAITLKDIQAARERIRSGIYLSPLAESIPLSEVAGCHVYGKLDYLQRTKSFKERGARHALLRLDQAAKKKGVVAASAGNHALGLAYHGSDLGVPITVVMPRFAPMTKVQSCRSYGAEVMLVGDTFDEARQQALVLAEERGLRFIPPYDDPEIIAGQGTMGLEIIEQLPEVEAIVVPVGGGGLAAGIAIAVKSLKPEVKIYGVEPVAAPSYLEARRAGHPVDVAVRPTLADGLATRRVGELTFPILNEYLDDVVTVSEDELAVAILRVVERESGVVEGAGAAGLAACIAGKLPLIRSTRTVLPLCGGNVDPITLSRVIEKGMVADGRLHRFVILMLDRPGSLQMLAKIIADAGANVAEILHDRAFSGGDVSATRVLVTLETRDREHVSEIHARLTEAGLQVVSA